MKPLFFALLLTFLPLTAHASDLFIVGSVAAVEGEVFLERKGEEKKAVQDGAPVALYDVVTTAKESRALVLLIDETQVTLAGNTALTVDEYVFDQQNGAANKGRFSVLRGAFMFVSGKLGKNGNPDVRIKTAYGSAGIRGTKLWCGGLKDNFGVFVENGRVDFTTNTGTAKLSAGQGTLVSSIDAAPGNARHWQESLIGEAYAKTALNSPVEEKLSAARSVHGEYLKAHKEAIDSGKLPVEPPPQRKHDFSTEWE